MRAILVSKRFHPGHYSHLLAYSKLLSSEGFQIRFRVHQNYSNLPQSRVRDYIATFSESLSLERGDIYFIIFPSFAALIELLFVRLLSSSLVIYTLHEPFTSFRSYRDSGFSWFKSFRVLVISIVSHAICSMAHKVILPSEKAYSCYLNAQRNNPSSLFKLRCAKINLVFEDESTGMPSLLSRDCISYIGTIAEDHAFDQFLSLINACISGNHLPCCKFLIATRSSIPGKYHHLIQSCVSSGRLIVYSGVPLSNHKINTLFRQSLVVWNAYARSMQSGVLPKAYMFATPVLASVHTSEYFQDGIHGALITNYCSLEEFKQAIHRIQSNFFAISTNCRNYYLAHFDYTALQRPFMKFIFS